MMHKLEHVVAGDRFQNFVTWKFRDLKHLPRNEMPEGRNAISHAYWKTNKEMRRRLGNTKNLVRIQICETVLVLSYTMWGRTSRRLAGRMTYFVASGPKEGLHGRCIVHIVPMLQGRYNRLFLVCESYFPSHRLHSWRTKTAAAPNESWQSPLSACF